MLEALKVVSLCAVLSIIMNGYTTESKTKY